METLSVELWTVVIISIWSASLTLVLAVGRGLTPGGSEWAVSNRHTPFEFGPWVQRTERAHITAIENLAPFAALILVIHVTGRSTDTTAIASMVFAGCRVAHSLSYIMGLVPWRTVLHAISIGALFALLTAFLP